MSKKLVVFSVDEEKLSELGFEFENELCWLEESAIYAGDVYEIPEGLGDLEPIETIWVARQVRRSLQVLLEYKQIDNFSEELVAQMVQEFHDNHESIDQDLHWKVCDYLKVEYKE
jgi:hypothetical protein